MAKQLQLRRGSTSEHGSFTGAAGEVSVDTDKDTVVVHDGETAGGFPLATATNFRSTGIDDNSNALAMTIDASENIGIGTTNPTTQASVSTFLEIDGGGTTAGLALNGFGSTSRWEIVADNGDDLAFFRAGGTAKMILTAQTRLGIGVAVPEYTIDMRGDIRTGTIQDASGTVSEIGVFDLTGNLRGGIEIENMDTPVTGNYSQKVHFITHHTAVGAGRAMTIDEDGKVGILTTTPAGTLDVDGTIYISGVHHASMRRLKEDIEEVNCTGLIDKFKKLPLYRYHYKPKVTKEELKDLALREFGTKISDAIEKVKEVRWTEKDTLPEGVKVGEIRTKTVEAQEEKWEWDKWDELFPDGKFGQDRLWDVKDAELKTFLDTKAEELRVERRTIYHQKSELHFGLIADDPELAENFPEVLAYREFSETGSDGEVWGIDPISYIGMLHGVIKELVQRVETLEAA